jgi:signal transduction histidine kinase
VRLTAGPTLDLVIEDNGAGFAPGARAGVGLLSMRERAEELGGGCSIEPRRGGGSQVVVQIPLERGTIRGA